jgi:hypothetical protein
LCYTLALILAFSPGEKEMEVHPGFCGWASGKPSGLNLSETAKMLALLGERAGVRARVKADSSYCQVRANCYTLALILAFSPGEKEMEVHPGFCRWGSRRLSGCYLV